MSQTIIIGHVALIQETKKQWFTIELLKVLREKGYDAVGVFAGECREKEYMDALYQRVKKYGLKENVAFLGRRNDIPNLLKGIDILIIPSTEGFPLAGLEAAAAGVPVIACDVAGAREFIQESNGGLTFKVDDVESAIDAVEGVIKNKKFFQAAGVKFASEMSYQKYTAKVERIFFKK